jgi:hypothetical protein
MYVYIFSTGVWTQCLHLEPLHQTLFFVMGFFDIGSPVLFALKALNHDPPDLCLSKQRLGLQAWTTGAWHLMILYNTETPIFTVLITIPTLIPTSKFPTDPVLLAGF